MRKNFTYRTDSKYILKIKELALKHDLHANEILDICITFFTEYESACYDGFLEIIDNYKKDKDRS